MVIGWRQVDSHNLLHIFLTHHFLKLGGSPLLNAHHGNALQSLHGGKFNDHEIPFVKFMLEQGPSKIAPTLAEAREQFRRSQLTPAQLAEFEAKEKEQGQILEETATQQRVQERMAHYRTRDQNGPIIEILTAFEIPVSAQLELLDAGLSLAELPYLTETMLVSHGIPALRAPRLLERLRDLQKSLAPSSPASSSSTDPNLLTELDLPHLTDEESEPMTKGGQGEIYQAKYAGAPCVVKRFTKGINRPEFVQAWKEFRHPHIVQLLAFLGPPDALIVMERMDGSLQNQLTSYLSCVGEPVPAHLQDSSGLKSKVEQVEGMVNGLELIPSWRS